MRNMKYLTSKVAQGRFLWGKRYSCYLVASLFRLFVGGENHQGLASTFTRDLITVKWCNRRRYLLHLLYTDSTHMIS